MSFLVFPFLLLLKREGLGYLAKIILPFAVISNIFYILSATSGVTLMPDTDIVQQDLPGGLKVYRVFGGTFFGEVFMLGIIFYWNEYRFKLLYVPFVILFGLPHLLAFGRGAWISFALTIFFIIIWSSIRKHNLKTFIRQVVTIMVTVSVFAYVYNQFVPRSEELTEAIEARIQQGQEDYRYGEGTYGTRMANIQALLNLWLTNPIFGIGMHPMWVIKPVTTEENIYSWGFSDVRWASVLAAYGAIGFLFAILFQLFYVIFSFRLLREIRTIDISYFFLLIFLTGMLRDTIISYSFILTTVNLFALGTLVAFTSQTCVSV
jgi:hypothetical protein